jgi:oligopeptide/dipeptide ABC transporter ATP-binding protein
MSDVRAVDVREEGDNVIEVRNLTVAVASAGRMVPAVRDVSFSIGAGQRVALVGESGAGKSLTGLALMRLLPYPSQQLGQIIFDGRDLMSLSERDLARLRGSRVAMVYQNPLSSLNPVRTIGNQIREVITIHDPDGDRVASREKVESLLTEVGLNMSRAYHRYPHELSGGQRQRVVIAMAIACEPALLIADEPTSALDVTTQQVIMELLVRLVEEHRMSLVFVTHDLPLAAQYCDEILVMYAGKIVERASLSNLLATPKHPYSRALVESVCTLDADPSVLLTAIPGQMPGVGAIPSGCAFQPRCTLSHGREICRTDVPPLRPVREGEGEGEGEGEPHDSACHFAEELAASQVRAGAAT